MGDSKGEQECIQEQVRVLLNKMPEKEDILSCDEANKNTSYEYGLLSS